MEDSDWTMIYSTGNPNEAEILKGLLIDHEIEVVLVNKKDSAYLFGEVEIYVPASIALTATQIINHNIE